MALVQCSVCKMKTTTRYGKCQHCGSVLKLGIWKRNLRMREVHAIIAVVIGIALLRWVQPLGVLAILAGAAVLLYGLFQPRIQS